MWFVCVRALITGFDSHGGHQEQLVYAARVDETLIVICPCCLHCAATPDCMFPGFEATHLGIESYSYYVKLLLRLKSLSSSV